MKEPVKVSMLVWNEFTNDARVLKEAETLQNNNYLVTVYALHTPGKTNKQEILTSGIRIKRIFSNILWLSQKTKNKNKIQKPIRRSGFFKKFYLILSRIWIHILFVLNIVKSKPNIIHAHDVNMLPAAWLSMLLSRAKLIYDAHEVSVDREGYAGFRKFIWCIEKFILNYTSGIITTTNTRAKFFARAYKIQRPVVLQNRPKYLPYQKSNIIREKLKLQHQWPIIVYQGGLQQGRGLEMLISITPKINNAYFVFIGNGRIKFTLQELVRELNVGDRVYFINTLSLTELPKYTAAADLGIQPILNTCFNHFSTDSNKLFEYIMAGLPVIASNLPEIRKIINSYEVGIVFKEGDSLELIKTIQLLFKDPKLMSKLQKNSIKSAKKLSWESQEPTLLKLYSSLI